MKRNVDEIMRLDEERRTKRQQLEDAQLGIHNGSVSHLTSYNCAPSNKMRNPKASRNNWDRGMSGRATPLSDLKITHSDDSVTIIPKGFHNSKGRARKTAKVWTPAKVAEASKIHLNHNFND